MHRVIRSIRRIAAVDLPASVDELPNRGIVHLGDDLYSCCIQEQSDDQRAAETGEREWLPVGDPHPGEQLTAGDVKSRYGRLQGDVRLQVLRAQVFQSIDDKGSTAKELVASSLAQQTAALAANVGLVNDAPLVDLSSADAERDEARRLAADPDNGIILTTVSMAAVDPIGDVVEAENLIPHVWTGEHPRL